MRTLVTGAFGNLGQSTMEILLASDHEITVLEVSNRTTKRIAKKLCKIKHFDIIWGSILDVSSVEEAVRNQECIIHFAGITPPLTEKNPKLAYDINVLGTQNILNAVMKSKGSPKIIYPSSVSIYGPLPPKADPITLELSINPIDNYTKTKAEAEKKIKESGLKWTILRITAVPSLSVLQNQLRLLYDVPLEQKLEFAHTRDIGKAIVNSITAATENKILLLGGGEKNRLVNRAFLRGFFTVLGIRSLPDEVFKVPKTDEDWYYTGWMDSRETQKLLNYQSLTYDDYLGEIKQNTRILRFFILLFRPLVKLILIRYSPYYKLNKKR